MIRLASNSLKVCFVVAAILPTLAFASYCTEPPEPTCIRYGAGFSDKSDFDMCKWEMDRYLQKIKSHQNCLKNEIGLLNQQLEDATRNANETIKKFNCFARNERICR